MSSSFNNAMQAAAANTRGGNAPASAPMPSGGAPAPQPRFQQSMPTPQQLPQSGLGALGSYTRGPLPPLSQGGGFFGANIQPVDTAANRNFALPASTVQSPNLTAQQAVFTPPLQSSLANFLSQYGGRP